MGSVLLVTTVGLLEPCLEAEVSSAIKMASKGAFVLSFVGITTARKILFWRGWCAILLIFGTPLRVFVQKYRRVPSPCRP
jgi:hypothetical protein